MFPKREIRFDEKKSKKIFKIKKLEVGDKFYTYDGYLNHIIKIFDDGNERLVAYKCWLLYKNRWGYYIEPLPSLIYSMCLTNDVPKNDRGNFFDLNGVDEKTWEIK